MMYMLDTNIIIYLIKKITIDCRMRGRIVTKRPSCHELYHLR